VLETGTMIISTPHPFLSGDTTDEQVAPEYYEDALNKVEVINFCLQEFGRNAGESLLCETIKPDRRVWDVFFPGMTLFLLNRKGDSYRKKYGSVKWEND
jgi:hypothetical protein